MFGKMFGGDRFEDLIGTISIGQSDSSSRLSVHSFRQLIRAAGKDMKEAFQQQAEEGDTVIGPTGRPMLTPEAMQRKMIRDRLRAEEAS